jgi:hypothetical protein
MTGGELTLGAVPARLEERESDITAQAETMREQVGQLTAQLDEPGRAARAAGTETAGSSGRPADHGGVHRGRPPAAGPRQVCEAMDLAVAPNNINNVRLKLKRLAGRGILTATEPGLFTQPRP